MTRAQLTALSCTFVMTAAAGAASAQTPPTVTFNVLARGTYDAFKVETEGLVDVELKAKAPLDVVIREHNYPVGSSTGWHTHPGPVLITVIEGELSFYEVDDPTCTPKVVRAGETYPLGGGYVDSGRGHVARNESGAPAKDVTVIFAPVGLPFRGNLSPYANPSCPFAF